MKPSTKAILTNAEVIAVDQDPLGVQGHIVTRKGINLQVWALNSSTGSYTASAVPSH